MRIVASPRLADGLRTVFLANAEGRLLDIIDIERWGNQACRNQTLQVPCAKVFQPHARATLQHGHICAVLSPSREIKVFAEGAELFTFRGASWHLLDQQAKYRLWAEAVGDEALSMRLFQTALDLACHEGYPGHHVYNVLLEHHLVRGRGWQEFTVYPLFSPQSLIAEGTANFGIDVAFPGAERTAFEREVLYPLAGLDPSLAERYNQVQTEVNRLSYAGNEAARRYLDGGIDRAAAEAYLVRYALMPPDRAAQRVRFIDQYRS